MALGATLRDNLIVLMRSTVLILGAGVALGWLISLAIADLIQPLLFEADATDPLVYTTAASCLIIAGILATLVPVLSAAPRDATSVMRVEH